jgi:CDP-diacylglycerol--serine O-phosphatidyltransferase
MLVSRKTPELAGREPRFGRRFRDFKSVPILPSLITLGNVFFGFLAVAKCTDGLIIQGADTILTPAALRLIEIAAIFVFVAMVFDGLDGAVARLTHQSTAFGAQLDSLADVVTFGVAPAFIGKALVDFYSRADVGWLPYHPKLYWAAAAIFVLCAAMRLARYNVEAVDDDGDHGDFVGLPTPAAASVVCSMVVFFATRGDEGPSISGWLLPPQVHQALVLAMPATLVVLGLLMVSRFPFPHMVATLVRGRHSFPFLATLVVLVFAAAIEWQFALLCLSLAYVMWGILLGLFRLLTRGNMDRPGGGTRGRSEAGDALESSLN